MNAKAQQLLNHCIVELETMLQSRYFDVSVLAKIYPLMVLAEYGEILEANAYYTIGRCDDPTRIVAYNLFQSLHCKDWSAMTRDQLELVRDGLITLFWPLVRNAYNSGRVPLVPCEASEAQAGSNLLAGYDDELPF
jgi:hypothetical protein